MIYQLLRWNRSKFTLVVGPSDVECDVWPLTSVWGWRVKREEIEDILVSQRLYQNDGEHAEWTVSVRLRNQTSHVLFRRGAPPDEALPEGMHRLATELAYELMRPVTRETRDDRKR